MMAGLAGLTTLALGSFHPLHRAKAGRAAYVPEENLKGHNDPGAEAVALVFEGLAEADQD